MKDELLNNIKGVFEKNELERQISDTADFYEKMLINDLDTILKLCHYMNESDYQTPVVVEGYAIVISDIALNIQNKMVNNGETHKSTQTRNPPKTIPT